MKIGVHIYFRPGFGGGERYLLTAAEALRSLGEVDFIAPTLSDLAAFERQFALDLSGVRAVVRRRRRLHGLRDWLSPRPYDFFFALDNHLAPVQLSLGRRGVLHLQTPPYPDPVNHPWRSRVKLRTYDLVACNSEYTRRWAVRYGTAGLPARVLYPPVDVGLYSAAAKRPIILSVGRFFTGRHEKKHGLLIDCFRDLVRGGMEGWELHLAGSFRDDIVADRAYLAELRRGAEGLPVVFHVNTELTELRRLYGEASLYWHGTGYAVDEEAHPQFLEHFGMSVVEAMAAGAIPVVVRRGGLVEIVADGETGFFWDEPAELVRRTRELAALGEPSLAPLRGRAVTAARRFSKERFAQEVRALARDLTGC
ncbi:MAG TPA: glycosyltransferase family 4 protein [Candidatus Binatia bacterium]|nr:glycosyltransferase family 4 protein [Candidatus Binatia bacterium]